MKIGNTTFAKSGKDMTFEQFQKALPKNARLGMSKEEAYQKLTGKQAKKKSKDDVRKAD